MDHSLNIFQRVGSQDWCVCLLKIISFKRNPDGKFRGLAVILTGTGYTWYKSEIQKNKNTGFLLLSYDVACWVNPSQSVIPSWTSYVVIDSASAQCANIKTNWSMAAAHYAQSSFNPANSWIVFISFYFMLSWSLKINEKISHTFLSLLPPPKKKRKKI